MRIMRVVLLGGAAVGLAVILFACGGATPSPASLTPITVQLKWIRQGYLAGFYAAEQQGYYAQEGLDVTFVEGGLGIDIFAPVLSGETQFGVASADTLILQRAAGNPVKAMAVLYRRSPVAIVAPAESGITRPEDLIGKTGGVTAFDVPLLHAMLSAAGVQPGQYTEVELASDVALWEAGEADAWVVYLNAFAVTLQQTGHELNFMYPDDYGVHFYSDTLFATDAFIEENPDVVTRFLRATLRGWTYAVENPGEIGAMAQIYQPDLAAEVMIAQMEASIPLVNTGEDSIGWMKPEVWAAMEQTLRDQGVLSGPLDVTEAYTMQFLEMLLADGQPY